MIEPETLDCWKVNYGLDVRTPEEAAAWWSKKLENKAPSGAIAALGICLNEIEELNKTIKRLTAAAENVIKKPSAAPFCQRPISLGSNARLSWRRRLTMADATAMLIVPIELSEAQKFVQDNHRHHGKVVGHKFSIGLSDGEKIRGVAIIGRPVARGLDDGMTLEVTRCCTDGVKNGCSKLYSAAWRACKAMGYQKLITYTLVDESGKSLVAAGWKMVAKTKGGSWSCISRPRVDKHPLQSKIRWEANCV